MEGNSKENPSEKPNLGIKRISKLGISKNITDDDKTKKNDLYLCVSGAKVVKVDFTIHTTFLLFCN